MPQQQALMSSITQHSDVALPMNLDQVDVVDIPDLAGKPVEEPTDSRRFRHALPMPSS